jgi:hypothetical protein
MSTSIATTAPLPATTTLLSSELVQVGSSPSELWVRVVTQAPEGHDAWPRVADLLPRGDLAEAVASFDLTKPYDFGADYDLGAAEPQEAGLVQWWFFRSL